MKSLQERNEYKTFIEQKQIKEKKWQAHRIIEQREKGKTVGRKRKPEWQTKEKMREECSKAKEPKLE